MKSSPLPPKPDRAIKILEWLGLACWIAIIPVKTVRWISMMAGSTLIDILPSILGSAGLTFVMLSASIKRPGWTAVRAAGSALVIALGLEFAQLLPRAGILARINYTFDWRDMAATVLGASIAFLLTKTVLMRGSGSEP